MQKVTDRTLNITGQMPCDCSRACSSGEKSCRKSSKEVKCEVHHFQKYTVYMHLIRTTHIHG